MECFTISELLFLLLVPVISISTCMAGDVGSYIIHMDKSAMPMTFSSHHDWRTLISWRRCRVTWQTYPDSFGKLHTTHSPKFLGLEKNSGAWPEGKFGEDMIIAILDTGVWPESESFRDKGMGPVPKRWRGACESGVEFKSSYCNRKLIGARSFSEGLKRRGLNVSAPPDDYDSPRDFHGHGTHTSSTAAGSPVRGANYFGYAEGTAIGISPKARLAMYKVIFLSDLRDADAAASDTLAGMDQAIADAGNSGPDAYTMFNGAPWITTIGAGTIDRDYAADVKLGGIQSYEVGGVEAAGAIFSSDSQNSFWPSDFDMPYVAVSPKDGDLVAEFSSRGPGSRAPMILKPDVLAPGVHILAAWAPNRAIQPIRDEYLLSDYGLLSGTSMASPHAVGVAALLKAAHPDWSPAAIRSAMMTTAYLLDNTQGPIMDMTTGVAGTPLDFGAGHINPNMAMDPGLVYDIEAQDYINFLCGLNYTSKQIKIITRRSKFSCDQANLDLNYPSFMVLLNNTNTTSYTFKRVLTNVENTYSVIKQV
ncbi:Subtilisin-like protease SBT4.8 [Vitis vinifera]|uniref:Subtilisin-like protease SBT4.8 n=1 Tax=Vitis vinifera TaxID=29760 RepID=A0A438EQ79_VITVI|nr:Subtilisin-like protease SBT4.8 [Vitis vinifera]